jgi:hypothetical protein
MENKSGQMARKTRTNNKGKVVHPYEDFESIQLWKIVDKAIGDLVKNGDIEEKTRREYIVGYICKRLSPDT